MGKEDHMTGYRRKREASKKILTVQPCGCCKLERGEMV